MPSRPVPLTPKRAGFSHIDLPNQLSNEVGLLNAAIFVYTITLILVCFAAAMLSVAAYAVSHKRSLIPQATFFICYIV